MKNIDFDSQYPYIRSLFENKNITGIAPIDKATKNHLSFCRFEGNQTLTTIKNSKAGVIVCHSSLEYELDQQDQQKRRLIFSSYPRLAFSKIVNHFFPEKRSSFDIHPSAQIGENVKIGENPYIETNVVIYDNVKIGDNCIIRAGAIIGTIGFGFERDKNGNNFRFPQVGSLIIGDNVEIGYNCTIDRGTIDKTIIEDGVKIDNFVHIGHNCRIGKNTLITAYSIFAGGVKIGSNCYIAPGCCFRDYIKVGSNAIIGIGSLVLKDVPTNVTVYGRPARIRGWTNELRT